MTYCLRISNWHPARKNQLVKGKLRTRMRLEKVDRNMVCGYCLLNRIPVATGPREVGLTITLGPRQRGGDVDAYWMSLLDSLVAAKMLIDDNRHYCRTVSPTYDRGPERATVIILTELGGET